MAAARKIMQEDDDFGFIRNHLDKSLADELKLFEYRAEKNGRITVESRDINRLHEQILAPKFNFGAPRIYVDQLLPDGSLVLRQDHTSDGRGLDTERAKKVLDYIHPLWQRPVTLYTVDRQGEPRVLNVK
jgi:stage V sporulation protein R